MLKRLFSILAALLFMAGAAPVVQAELADLGIPIDPHGYPAWYSDANGLQLELCVPPPAGFATRPELCIGDPIEVDGEGNPINPIVLTGESFWWMASASVDMPGGGSADLEFAIEATFGGAEAAIDGQQISFGRTRIRIDTPAIGTYTVTHPYGVIEFEVTDAAEGINYTSDIGAANFLDPAAGFRGTLSTPIGPFLTWPDYASNPDLQVLAGDGTTVLEQYVGDPSILSTVVGSPTGNNFVRIEGPEGSGIDVQTAEFSVMGKVFDPTQAQVAHVFPEAPFPIWFAVGPTNRVAPFAIPTTGTVTGVDFTDYAVGYPIWYQENIGTITEPAGGVKVTLCTPGDPMCISDPIDTNVPEQVALRTGGEGFWWIASAGFDVGEDALSVEFALEATFGGDESLIDGQQISFTRTRIRIDTNGIGAGTYRVTHPYGTDIFENVPADDVGINHTADVGIANPADPDGAFVGAMYSLGPQILKWDTFNVDPALTDVALVKPHILDPNRTNYFVGDPTILHTVTGSPTGNNFFRVEKLDGDDWVLIGETDEFSVSGQVFDPAFFPLSLFVNDTELIQQLYRDLLNREGDAAGVQFWVGLLTNQTVTRAQVVEAFLASPEFSQNTLSVIRLYFAYFNDIASFGGLMDSINLLGQGASLEDISATLAGSAEFQATYGSLANLEFVQAVYQNLLGREADADGLAFWTGELDSGNRTRSDVMVAFSQSAEYTSQDGTPQFVTSLYAGLLRRAPDAGGFDFWSGWLNDGNPSQGMIDIFLNSEEFTARF